MEGAAVKVRLDEMSWPDVREFLTKPHAIILPIGSTEEHGAHLPLNVDSLTVTYIAESAARKVMEENNLNVLVAPTIDYTDVSPHKMFPGTIGVKLDTYLRVLVDIMEAFLDQGFQNIIALSGHLENNSPLEVAVRMVKEKRPKANLFALTAVHGLGFEAMPGLVKAVPAGIGHALEIETSYSMVIQPQNVHLEKTLKGYRKLPISTRYIGPTGQDKSKGVLYCSGVLESEESGTAGDPTMASKEAGEKLLAAITKDLADIVVQVINTTPPK
jgi:creatinine amidohydrolase